MEGCNQIITNRGKFEGKVFKTNRFGDVLITNYINYSNVHVEFIDSGYKTVASLRNIRMGDVKDRSVASVYGIGIIGDQPTRLDGKTSREYSIWRDLLKRCGSKKLQEKYPTYKACTVSDNFKYYPYFKDWCNKQIGFDSKDDKGKSFALDKDILIKGNKVYSEDTCVFVPQEINNILIKHGDKIDDLPVGITYDKLRGKFKVKVYKYGEEINLGYFDGKEDAFLAYKEVKGSYIKEVAEYWKDAIDSRVYESLLRFEV